MHSAVDELEMRRHIGGGLPDMVSDGEGVLSSALSKWWQWPAGTFGSSQANLVVGDYVALLYYFFDTDLEALYRYKIWGDGRKLTFEAIFLQMPKFQFILPE